MRHRLFRSRYWLLLLIPGILHVFIFSYIPMYGIIIAFKNYHFAKGVFGSEWVGLEHFSNFFRNPDFFRLIKNTVLLNIYSLIFAFPVPIIVAILIYEAKGRVFKRIVQTVSYMPHFLSTVAIVSILTILLSPQSGMINHLLNAFGMESKYFLADSSWFRTLYVSSGIWQSAGFGAIIYLAALSSLDTELFDSAYIDGANRFQRIWYISLPGILPIIVITFLLALGGLLDVGFEKVYLMQMPMTYETSDVISTYVYRVGLYGGNFSYGTAIGLFNTVINITLLAFFNYIAKKTNQATLW